MKNQHGDLSQQVTCPYYLGGRQVAFKKGDDLEYLHQDHLGSTSVTNDATGNEVSTVKYFPFGGIRAQTGDPGTDKLFTGQRLDQTGLYFYNARYYDAEIGRFISPDSIVPDPFDPQSFNRYSYCLNNPLRYTDPSGHQTEVTEAEVQALCDAIREALAEGWDGSDDWINWWPESPSSTLVSAVGKCNGVELSTSTASFLSSALGLVGSKQWLPSPGNDLYNFFCGTDYLELESEDKILTMNCWQLATYSALKAGLIDDSVHSSV